MRINRFKSKRKEPTLKVYCSTLPITNLQLQVMIMLLKHMTFIIQSNSNHLWRKHTKTKIEFVLPKMDII